MRLDDEPVGGARAIGHRASVCRMLCAIDHRGSNAHTEVIEVLQQGQVFQLNSNGNAACLVHSTMTARTLNLARWPRGRAGRVCEPYAASPARRAGRSLR